MEDLNRPGTEASKLKLSSESSKIGNIVIIEYLLNISIEIAEAAKLEDDNKLNILGNQLLHKLKSYSDNHELDQISVSEDIYRKFIVNYSFSQIIIETNLNIEIRKLLKKIENTEHSIKIFTYVVALLTFLIFLNEFNLIDQIILAIYKLIFFYNSLETCYQILSYILSKLLNNF